MDIFPERGGLAGAYWPQKVWQCQASAAIENALALTAFAVLDKSASARSCPNCLTKKNFATFCRENRRATLGALTLYGFL